jgi:transposase
MSKGIRFTEEFKRDAVAQVVERGYAVSEVAERLGISTKSLYTWKAQFSKPRHERAEVLDQAAEIRRLKRELARVTEERTILKKGEPCAPLVRAQWQARTSRASLSELRVHRGQSGRVFGAVDVPGSDGSFQRVLCMA